MAVGRALLVFALLPLAVGQPSTAPTFGSSECPCMTAISTDVINVIQTAGFPPNYGTQGCDTYDEGLVEIGCGSNDDAFCGKAWCYVNTSICPYDASKCEAAGGNEGSTVSPFCRTRPSSQSTLFAEISLAYSYHTCSTLDLYTTPAEESKGKAATIVAAFAPTAIPYIAYDEVDSKRPELKGAIGSAIEIFYDLAFVFNPPYEIQVSDTFASAPSLKEFRSSYTACTHDVALGRVDICIGGFWVTPQRMSMSYFLPAFADSMFYLSVPAKNGEESFSSMLAKPFAPFSIELWALTVGFVVFSGLVMLFAESRNTEDFPNQSIVARMFKSMYLSFLGYFSGGPANNPVSVPGRLVSLGFSFFVLIALASYTANLATILVANSAQGGIKDIDDAISKGVSICIPSAVQEKFEALYPNALFVAIDDTNALPRHAHQGDCTAFIDSDVRYRDMRGGKFNTIDCQAVDESDGALTDEDMECDRDGSGQPTLTRDCAFVRAGGLITTVAVSLPISERLLRSWSWAMVDLVAKGVTDKAVNLARDQLLPPDRCGAAADASQALNELSLPANAMAGTLVVSVTFMLVAVTLAVVERVTQRSLQEILSAARYGVDSDAATKRDESGLGEGDGSSRQLHVMRPPTMRVETECLGPTRTTSDRLNQPVMEAVLRLERRLLAEMAKLHAQPASTAEGGGQAQVDSGPPPPLSNGAIEPSSSTRTTLAGQGTSTGTAAASAVFVNRQIQQHPSPVEVGTDGWLGSLSAVQRRMSEVLLGNEFQIAPQGGARAAGSTLNL